MTEPKKKILVVDDEPTVRHLVRRLLSREFEIAEAENGEEAVTVAKEQKPDLILMDMMMPKMDGLSACYHIKQDKETGQVPIVMLTAITHDLNKRLSQNVMGANGYITKPFDPAELVATVRKLLNTESARA
jgi:CheY-like chemotaxis protein